MQTRDGPEMTAAPVENLASMEYKISTASAPRKGSVKPRKQGSGTGYNLPAIRSLDWENNSKGGYEAWHVPPGTTHRREKTYLGYVGKKLLSSWQNLPTKERRRAVEDWIAEKRAKKKVL